MHIGFTGTQKGMTNAQRHTLAALLRACTGLHHGDCVGADMCAHNLATALGVSVTLHPPDNPAKRAYCKEAAVICAPKPYLIRNKNIVTATTHLIAAPGELTEQLRSGTWSTVRFARKLGRPIAIIFLDGSCTFEREWTLHPREWREDKLISELQSTSPANRARRVFSSWCAKIEQAGQQHRPLTSIDLRRMEFEAVQRIARELGAVL